MSSSAEFLALLRTRSERDLGEVYRVTAGAHPTKAALWVGPKMRCELLAAADLLDADRPDASGLLIHPAEGGATLPVIAALLSAPLLGRALERPLTRRALEALPLPGRHPLFEAQLEALWHHAAANFAGDTSAHAWSQVLGSFDRICAELYQLTLDELMDTLV